MKWNRDEYISLMTSGAPKRQMFCELFGPLIGLEDEWKAQGAAAGEVNLTDFCFDYVPYEFLEANTGIMGGYTPQVLEDNDSYRITRDRYGRTMKLIKNTATIPLPLDHPVKDMDTWKAVKPFFVYNQNRVNRDKLREALRLQNEGVFIIQSIPGGFDLPRQLMGEEALCYAIYDQPELVMDIIETITDTACRVADDVCEIIIPDSLCVHEDMAGKTGPLFGPEQVNMFMKPYYSAVWDKLRRKGTRLFSQDSDGNMNPVMDEMIACGVNVFYPLEPAAGMDIVRLREKYGRQIAFKGGIDKHALRAGRDAIKNELKNKITPLMKEGGCVFAIDHRIPNGTPIKDYRYYVDTAREMLGLPPRSEDEAGWARMAF